MAHRAVTTRAPFSARDGDIRLHSTPSNIDFRVHRSILAIASPIFGDMFTLPQASHHGVMTEIRDETPKVDLPEDRNTLDALLRLIYPVIDPVFHSLDQLIPVLAAAVKYEMGSVVADLRRELVSATLLTSKTALQVFAISDRFSFEHELKIASRWTLHTPLLKAPLSDDLKHITAHSFFRLIVMHRNRADGLEKVLAETPDPACRTCSSSGSYSSRPAIYKGLEDVRSRARSSLESNLTGDEIVTVEFVMKSRQVCATCCDAMISLEPRSSFYHSSAPAPDRKTILETLRERFGQVQDTI
jgi:hypothetical protein